MTTLVLTDIKDNLPTINDEMLIVIAQPYRDIIDIVWGRFSDGQFQSFDKEYEIWEDETPYVTHWFRKVELPSINELRCIATDQANLHGEVDKIDYLEGFVKASEYIMSLLKPKN